MSTATTKMSVCCWWSPDVKLGKVILARVRGTRTRRSLNVDVVLCRNCLRSWWNWHAVRGMTTEDWPWTWCRTLQMFHSRALYSFQFINKQTSTSSLRTQHALVTAHVAETGSFTHRTRTVYRIQRMACRRTSLRRFLPSDLRDHRLTMNEPVKRETSAVRQ